MSQQLSTRLFFLFFSILFLTLFSRLAPQDMLRRLRAARRLDWDWSEWASERALDGKQSEEAWWNGEPKTKSWMNIASPWERFLECLQSVMVSWRFSCSSVGETFQQLFRWEPSLREPHKRTSSWVFFSCSSFVYGDAWADMKDLLALAGVSGVKNLWNGSAMMKKLWVRSGVLVAWQNRTVLDWVRKLIRLLNQLSPSTCGVRKA